MFASGNALLESVLFSLAREKRVLTHTCVAAMLKVAVAVACRVEKKCVALVSMVHQHLGFVIRVQG